MGSETDYLLEHVDPGQVDCPEHGPQQCSLFHGPKWCRKRIAMITGGYQTVEISTLTERFYIAQWDAKGERITKVRWYETLREARDSFPHAMIGKTLKLAED